jgi:hypothetical protein
MDTITIRDRQFRVEANWRAITGYLKSIGKDSLDAVADVVSLSPSTIGGLMAACINEGERLEGRDARVTAAILDDLRPAEAVKVVEDFVHVYLSQAAPALPEEPKKEEAQ